jgi:CDGSH-type Zn-finger protein
MEKKELREELVPCGCGRSPSGYCTGLHEMTEEQYENYLLENGFEDSE